MDVTSYLLGKKAGGGSAPTLQSKDLTITSNGTQTVMADSGYDGLSDVDITTNVSGGASDYFVNTITTGTSQIDLRCYIKKIPTITIPANGRSLSFSNLINVETIEKIITESSSLTDTSYFLSAPKLTSVDLSEFDTSNVTNMSGMFNCQTLTTLDLSNFNTGKVTRMDTMFSGCRSLTYLDIRNFTFDSVTSYSNMFGSGSLSVPSSCEIIVKEATQKQWINTNFSRLTNVKTVAEYEAEQS